MRKNEKESLISYESSIKKSNEISLAKLNQGLTLNQMQLLAFAIFSTQMNGVTEFHKADFERKFKLEKYQTKHAKEDSYRLLDLKIAIEDLENDRFRFWNVFMGMEYEKGLFKFEWNPKMIPHIIELKNKKFVLTDLNIASQFKSSFSWALYDCLKVHYGYWHKVIKKDALMRLFCVENVASYQKNTGLFKKKVLDVAIQEINNLTEFEVWYKEIKKGRLIDGFDLHWTTGEKVASATKKQISELKAIIDIVFEDVFKYVNLKNDDNRQRAIDLAREIEEMRSFTEEPICITKEHASSLLQKSSATLKELEQMLEYERTAPKVSFYNWLDERQ